MSGSTSKIKSIIFSLVSYFYSVSAEVAMQMTAGALQYSVADYAIAITGIAGPTLE
jgi:nicotinamide mononucleotide (NMN) deamidase PncC